MKKKLLLLTTIFLTVTNNLAFSQSQKKIIVQSPLASDQNYIIPGDIAYSGDVTMTPPESKLIGYSYRTDFPTKAMLGFTDILEDGTILFSTNYYYSPDPLKIFEVRRIASAYWTGLNSNSSIYTLAALQTSTNIFMPVLIQMNNSTGIITNSYFFNNIPITDEAFVPLDIIVSQGNLSNPTIISMLCVGYNYNAPAGTPTSSLYVIDYNLTVNSYSVTRIYNNSDLGTSYDYATFSFLKSYHCSSNMAGGNKLAFAGIESPTGNVNRGMVFTQNQNNIQTCKYYTLNNNTTFALQVNYPEDLKQSVLIQDSYLNFYIECNDETGNTNYWKRTLRSNDGNLFSFVMGNHGNKSTTANNIDFFTGEHMQPSAGVNGYLFLRYDYTNGDLKQSYFYSARNQNRLTLQPAQSYFNQYNQLYHFIGNSRTKTTETFQYFYLIENDLDQDQTNCVTIPTFTDVDLPVTIQSELPTFSIIATNLSPSDITLTMSAIPAPVIDEICGDSGGQTDDNKALSSPTPSIQFILQKYIESSLNRIKDRFPNTSNTNSFVKVEKHNNSSFRLVSNSKKIVGYNIYTSVGQLLYRQPKKTGTVSLEINNSYFKTRTIYFIEVLFEDGTKETKAIF